MAAVRMIVERLVFDDRLFALIVAGPCPWCTRASRHAHEIRAEDVDREPLEVAGAG